MSDRKPHSESQEALRSLIAEVEGLLTPDAKLTLWGLEQLKKKALDHLGDPHRGKVEVLAFQPEKKKLTGSAPVTEGAKFIIPPGWTSKQCYQHIENELCKFLRILRDATSQQSSGTTYDVSQDEFTHGPDFRSVTIRKKPFTLNDTEAKIIRTLWEARENGTPDVGLAILLSQVGATSYASRLRDVFKNRPAYKELVTWKTRGTFRLNLPDSK